MIYRPNFLSKRAIFLNQYWYFCKKMAQLERQIFCQLSYYSVGVDQIYAGLALFWTLLEFQDRAKSVIKKHLSMRACAWKISTHSRIRKYWPVSRWLLIERTVYSPLKLLLFLEILGPVVFFKTFSRPVFIGKWKRMNKETIEHTRMMKIRGSLTSALWKLDESTNVENRSVPLIFFLITKNIIDYSTTISNA